MARIHSSVHQSTQNDGIKFSRDVGNAPCKSSIQPTIEKYKIRLSSNMHATSKFLTAFIKSCLSLLLRIYFVSLASIVCCTYQKIFLKNESKYFHISLQMNTALFRTLINLKMSGRPKHSVSKLNYSELADIKVPRRTLSTKVNKTTLSKSSTLYRLKILERDEENKRVKVR